MGDGRWAGWAMVDGHWGTKRLLLAGLQPRRAKGGSWEGNQRCSHFKDDTSSFLPLLLTFPPSNKKDGRLQEYFQLLGEASSEEDHQTGPP